MNTDPNTGLHSEEAERGLLGAILIDPLGDPRDAFMSTPTAAFWLPRHQTIAARVRTMLDTGIDLDLVTLTDNLRVNGELEQVGSVAYLLGMAEDLLTTEHAHAYATTIQDLWHRRNLAAFGSETIQIARDRTRPLDDAYGLVETKLTSAIRSTDESGNLDAYADEALDVLEPGGGGYLRTGIHAFDDLTGGMKGLVIVGARPSMGKSSLARDVLRHQHALGKRVALFTQDQSASEVFSFETSIASKVPFHLIQGGKALPEERERWRYANRQLREQRRDSFIVDDRPHNLHALTSKILAAARWGADLVAVDYLQLVDVPGVKDGNMVHTVTMISKALKHLTQELGIPILALAQLSRAVEARSDKRPMLSDLRESGQIEQDANMVVLLYRPEYYQARAEGRAETPESLAELIVAKNKTGPSGTARVVFESHFASFRDRDRRADTTYHHTGDRQ